MLGGGVLIETDITWLRLWNTHTHKSTHTYTFIYDFKQLTSVRQQEEETQ